MANPGEKVTVSFNGVTITGKLSVDGIGVEVAAVKKGGMETEYQEYRPSGKYNVQPLTIEVEWDHTTHGALLTAAKDKTVAACVVAAVNEEDAADETLTFDAFISSLTFGSGEEENNISASITFQPTGELT